MSSGTYSFLVSANDIVASALRQTGRFASYDTLPTADTTNVLQALNMLVKALVKNQKPLWCVQRVTVPLALGTASYNLSTITGQTRPLRVLYAFIRDSAGNDTEVKVLARDDYSQLGQKTSQGVPNQAYYDPQLGAGSLTVYNVPSDGTHTLYVDIQRQVQDFNLLTDNPDFPQEAYLMLKWMLADEISLEYLTPQDMRADIKQKAAAAYDAFFAAEREEASTSFTPSDRRA
jgi:hypothetical protein